MSAAEDLLLSPPPKLSASDVRVLSIGLDRKELAGISAALMNFQHRHMPMDVPTLVAGAFNKTKAGPKNPEPHLVLVAQPPDEVDIGELGQTVRMQFHESQIYAIVWDRSKFHRPKLRLNGFNDGFLLPFEAYPLKRTIDDFLRRRTNGGILSYRPLRVSDLRPGTTLPFSLAVYLPLNNKYVPFHIAGDTLTADRYEKMVAHKMAAVLINTDELPAFYEYAGRMSLTERRHILEDSFRSALSDLLRGGEIPLIKESEKFIADCQTAVTRCILDYPKEHTARQVMSTMGEIEDHYNHTLNTATYAALFSRILKIGDPVWMAISGLLHDIGELDVPISITARDKGELRGGDLKVYESHAERTLHLLRELRLPMPSFAVNAIAQHHEEVGGGGYPTSMNGTLMTPEAQVIAFADRFDYLTRRKSGEAAVSIEESIEKVKFVMRGKWSRVVYPDIVDKVLAIFTAR